MKVRKKRNISIFIFIFIALSTLVLNQNGIFQKIENIAYDAASKKIRSDKSISSKVAVVLIDEVSLGALQEEVGRWPWPRAIYSDLLDFFSMGKPEAIFFDILFTEEQKPREDGKLNSDDLALSMATAEAGNIYHAMQLIKDKEFETGDQNKITENMPALFLDKFALKEVSGAVKEISKGSSFFIPFKELYESSGGMAVVEFSADGDGVYRRSSPIREFNGSFFPVPGLAPFIKEETISIEEKNVKIGAKVIPVDETGNIIINAYGSFNPYSISGLFASLKKIREGDVENIMVDPEVFRDKIIYIGSSAVGVEDLKPTSISPLTPGVFLHASLASNFLLNDFLRPVNKHITFLTVFIFSFICTFSILFQKRYFLKILVPLICLTGWTFIYLYAFKHNLLLKFTPPAFTLFFASISSLAFLVLTEEREKLNVRRMFSQYVSEEVLKQISNDYGEYVGGVSGEKVDITVLFTDLRGFTTLSDKSAPEVIVKILNVYLSKMCDEILSRQGTVDKFIGDSIMAFWGAPLKVKNHAELAVRSAIGLVHKLDVVNEEIKRMGFDFSLAHGIGINTGSAILGNIGSEKRLSYTVIGDTVNTASRLEALNKRYGVSIIISEHTYERVKDVLPCRIIEKTSIRGKAESITIYEALCFRDDDSLKRAWELCKKTDMAYALYENGELEKAYEIYKDMEDSTLRNIFIEKCKGSVITEKRSR